LNGANITGINFTAVGQVHTATASWVASTSVVSGYNVYRGTVSGGPYTKLNGSFIAALSYADTTVQRGQTYFYVTTAVDGSGNESVFSNEVTAVIP
jgi:fibronectin type 3 domain-containing protein